MTNIYDTANGLEKAIRESNEFKELKQAFDAINSDESAKRMFDNFREMQLHLQQKQMQGEEITQEEVEQAQRTVELVQQHEAINKLMEMEQRLSMILNEVNRIMMKPLEELYGLQNM